MAFDPTVSLGNIITIATTGIGLIIYFVKQKTKMDELESSLKGVTTAIENFREADKQMAVMGEKVEKLEEDMKSNVLAVLSHRVTELEKELGRARENIHLMGNQIQVELFRKANEKTSEMARR